MAELKKGKSKKGPRKAFDVIQEENEEDVWLIIFTLFLHNFHYLKCSKLIKSIQGSFVDKNAWTFKSC